MSLVFAIAIMSSQQQSFSWGVLPLRIRVQGQTFPSLPFGAAGLTAAAATFV